MGALARTLLLSDEQALVERFIVQLDAAIHDELHAVWLFGSRARGEEPTPESDVDLLVLVDDATWDGRMLVREMLDRAAHDLGLQALTWSFSIHVHTLGWLAQRREVGAFIAEVDRDRALLHG